MNRLDLDNYVDPSETRSRCGTMKSLENMISKIFVDQLRPNREDADPEKTHTRFKSGDVG